MGHEPLDEGERSYAQKGISIPSLFEHVKKIWFDPSRVRSPLPGFSIRSDEASGLRLVQGSKS